ncbi:MAG: GNAT family N-acetyltransferase [Cyclobacteriaceae bacterium]
MIKIREAYIGDAQIITEFQLKMALETEKLWLDEQVVTKGVEAVLNQPNLGKYLIAEKELNPVGVFMITYEWSDWRNATVLWMQSVYVNPESRGEGVFTQMYSYLKKMVNTNPDYCGVRLYVVKNNEIAKSAYHNVGMSHEHYEMFEWMKPKN